MSFRRDYITKPIFSFARGVLPPMSDTEREALEAGDVWWDADLFTRIGGTLEVGPIVLEGEMQEARGEDDRDQGLDRP